VRISREREAYLRQHDPRDVRAEGIEGLSVLEFLVSLGIVGVVFGVVWLVFGR
jgi:hypothetical protein